jgi:hypothetical protein
MRRLARGLIIAVCGSVLAGAAFAQDPRQNEPGKFDFYLLALSWSPSFCAEAGDRPNARQQCGERPFSFVVHGLWPQYEKGSPEFCQNPPPFVDNKIVNAMLDLMPARGLVINEWKKHGTCSGLQARGYFETVRDKDPARLSRSQERAHRDAGRGRGGLRQGQSGLDAHRHRGDVLEHAPLRSAHLPHARPAVPRVRRCRPPRLPARQAGDAAGARRMKVHRRVV